MNCKHLVMLLGVLALRSIPVAVIAAFVVCAGVQDAVAATAIYDWNNAAASMSGVLVDGNDGWSKVAGVGDGSEDVVRNAFAPSYFGGRYYQSTDVAEPGNGDSIYARLNDANFSYSIPSAATQVTLSARVQHAALSGFGDAATVSLAVHGVAAVLQMGNGYNGWAYRDVGDANTTSVNGTGAGVLDGTSHAWIMQATIDMTPAGTTKTMDMWVQNLTDGGTEQIFDNALVYLGAYADPSTWNGLGIRVNGMFDPAYLGEISVSWSTIPEPGSALLVIAGTCLLAARRRRG